MNDVTLFDYASMTVHEQVEVQSAAVRIRDRMKRTVEDIIAIGQDLIAVKEKLPHGAFLPWIEAEFGMKDQTARNMMNVASMYSDKFPNFGNLAPSVFYEIAAPSTPEVVRQAVEAKAEAGESVSVAEVKAMIAAERKRADEADRRANDATAEAERQKAKADDLADGQRELISKARADAEASARQAAADDLLKVRAEAEKAKNDLAAERKKLETVTKEAEAAALAKAQSQAASLAAAELAKIQNEAKQAENRLAEARRAYDRKKDALEGLQETITEQEAYVRNLGNRTVEANNLLKVYERGSQFLADAMITVSDVSHSHEEAVTAKLERLAQHLRQFADALDHIEQSRPDMRVVG